MHPILIKIFGITITYYGLLVATGVIFGLFLASKLGNFLGLDENKIFDIGIFTVIFAIVGARIFYILLNFKYFLMTPGRYIFSRAGFVFLGGFIGGAAYIVIYALVKKIHLGELGDIYAPALAIGHAIGRQGCLLNGCCYGIECSPHAFFATKFNNLLGYHLPTQLFESIAELFIFLILINIFRKRRFRGQVMVSYVILYSIWRFFIEFIRGDYSPDQVYILHFTFSQVIILIFLPIMILLYLILKKYDKI
ncbi:prolipoprotein diacylglyceryl transferase [bacterium]|nr:prolipoprotein diacylglyceryl transferase [bacterium]